VAGKSAGGTAPILSGTTVKGALACSGNTAVPADLGVPNELSGAGAGQCAKLAHGVQGGAYEAVQHLGE
jgi:hypothetical protein